MFNYEQHSEVLKPMESTVGFLLSGIKNEHDTKAQLQYFPIGKIWMGARLV